MTEKETDITWALDLLTAKEEYEHSFFPYGYPIVVATAGFISACGANFLTKRPVFSGIQKHIFFTGGAGAVGYWFQKRAEGIHAERDAVLRHYITLHPEDFPPPDRKKWKDVLAEWVPIR